MYIHKTCRWPIGKRPFKQDGVWNESTAGSQPVISIIFCPGQDTQSVPWVRSRSHLIEKEAPQSHAAVYASGSGVGVAPGAGRQRLQPGAGGPAGGSASSVSAAVRWGHRDAEPELRQLPAPRVGSVGGGVPGPRDSSSSPRGGASLPAAAASARPTSAQFGWSWGSELLSPTARQWRVPRRHLWSGAGLRSSPLPRWEKSALTAVPQPA